MGRHRMRIDYNNFVRQVLELVTDSVDENVQNSAWMVGIGFELLTSYLKDIAKIAIERNDEELLEICKGLLIVYEETEGKQ